MIERLDIGTRMSKIVQHHGIVYLCGQVGEGETIADQTRTCLERVDSLLLRAGSSRGHLLQATIWLASMKDFEEMNASGTLGCRRPDWFLAVIERLPCLLEERGPRCQALMIGIPVAAESKAAEGTLCSDGGPGWQWRTCFVEAWKEQIKPRSHTGCAAHVDASVPVLDNPKNHREPEPGPAFLRLCREKRVEYLA